MREDEQCKVLCRIEALTTDQSAAFKSKIDDEYRVNMCVVLALLSVMSLPSICCSLRSDRLHRVNGLDWCSCLSIR
jgi:hypothetical protein